MLKPYSIFAAYFIINQKSFSMKKLLLSALLLSGAYFVNAEDVVIFEDDFEWLEPWSSLTPAGRTVETDDLDATAQQLGTNKVDDVATYDALLAKGYEFMTVYHSSKAAQTPKQNCYLQRNYIKFGKTGYYSGITLPNLTELPKEGCVAVVSFDWCTMRQGSGTMDPTKLVVIVKNGDNEMQFDVPEHGMEKGSALKWIPVEIALNGAEINADTRITIRNCDEQWPDDGARALRWFMDNIKLSYDASTTGIDDITVNNDSEAEYYNLQGIKVNKTEAGKLYIVRQGNKTSKVIM